MPNELIAVESSPVSLELGRDAVAALLALGRELSAGRAWWGDVDGSHEKSVVDVVRGGGSAVSVTFRDVVGVVRVGDVQIRVRPKIPEAHFAHVVRQSELAPRIASASTAISAGSDLASLIATWCVVESELLLRYGLRADYTERHEELYEVRGRVNMLPTLLALQSGRPVASCEYEEFSDDSPLNRIVKAACLTIASNSALEATVRKRARRVALRMSEVGTLRAADRQEALSRLTRGYSRVIPLARIVLQAGGVSMSLGAIAARAFLIRTPELVEAGLTSILARRLPFDVRKRKIALGQGFTISPDLVFSNGLAIGDIKYRLLSEKWNRANLYQVVAYATALYSPRAAVLGFYSGSSDMPPPVKFGGVAVTALGWNAGLEADPKVSEDSLIDSVTRWLTRELPPLIA